MYLKTLFTLINYTFLQFPKYQTNKISLYHHISITYYWSDILISLLPTFLYKSPDSSIGQSFSLVSKRSCVRISLGTTFFFHFSIISLSYFFILFLYFIFYKPFFALINYTFLQLTNYQTNKISLCHLISITYYW